MGSKGRLINGQRAVAAAVKVVDCLLAWFFLRTDLGITYVCRCWAFPVDLH